MRKIIVSEFVTLDGVMEAPGGEKSLGERSGWTFPFSDQEQMKFKYEELFASGALLLGRVTYQGFAAAWPTLKGTGDFGDKMNGIQKFVISKTLNKLDWNNSMLVSGDVKSEIQKLKEMPGGDILVYGSGQLVQGLTHYDLVDEYRLMVFPVILGTGKHLFTDAKEKKTLQLRDVKKFGSGVVVLTYEPAPAAAATH